MRIIIYLRIYETHFYFLKELHEKVKVLYLKGKLLLSEVYEDLFNYPFVKHILTINKSMLTFLKDSFQFYMNNYNLRTLFEMALSRMNIYVSTALRLVDFWYNSGKLLSYQFDYDPNNHLVYNQILPIYWNSFRVRPTFMLLGHNQVESTFDITFFYFHLQTQKS